MKVKIKKIHPDAQTPNYAHSGDAGLDLYIVEAFELEPGERTIVDLINAGEIQMVVNTPTGQAERADGYEIRAATTSADKPIITTVQELWAAVQGIEALQGAEPTVRPIQEVDHS